MKLRLGLSPEAGSVAFPELMGPPATASFPWLLPVLTAQASHLQPKCTPVFSSTQFTSLVS